MLKTDEKNPIIEILYMIGFWGIAIFTIIAGFLFYCYIKNWINSSKARLFIVIVLFYIFYLPIAFYTGFFVSIEGYLLAGIEISK